MPDKDFSYYRSLAQIMLDNDQERNEKMLDYDDMYHVKFDLPEEVNDIPWMRAVPDTGAADSIDAGIRVLSATKPKITMTPLAPNEATRREANDRERNLSWQLSALNRRRSRSVQADMAESALRYAAVAAVVIDLDWQIKRAKERGRDTSSMEMARRYSRFVVNVYNPKNVHVRRSIYGNEAVLLATKRKAIDVVAEWSHMAEDLQGLVDNDDSVTYYYMMDLKNTVVWCEPEINTGEDVQGQGFYVIEEPRAHDLPFLPWVAMMGGSNLEDEEEKKYRPTLYALGASKNWDTHNLIRSINVSERIALAASPRYKEEGPGQGITEMDFTDPARIAKVTTGNTLDSLPTPAPDLALSDLDDRLATEAERSTVSRILQGGSLPSGTAFATLNLQTQTALGALKPPQELTEKSLAEMFTIMLLWVWHTKNNLHAYGTLKRNDAGTEYIIKADELEPDAMYLEVEISTDQPTDRIQRANTAALATQFGYSKVSALEDMGVTDPEAELDRWYDERLFENEFNLLLQRRQQEVMLELQQMQQQLQAMQAQVMQQQQAQQEAQQAALQASAGGAFNPAEGGITPNMAQPGMMEYESATGNSRGGQPVAVPEL